MRTIDTIIVHASATRADTDIGVEEIRRWHVEDNGWSDIGYHYIIRRSGEVEYGRPIERIGAHVKGHNKTSIGICMVGGIGENGEADANYTIAQYNSLVQLLYTLKVEYTLTNNDIFGHRDFTKLKACPCFDIQGLLS